MFAGDDFKISAKASSTLGKPADSVRSDTALKASSPYPSAGSSNAPSPGSAAAADWPRIGNASTARRSPSCASPPFASCCENYAIPRDVLGQTLNIADAGVTWSASNQYHKEHKGTRRWERLQFGGCVACTGKGTNRGVARGWSKWLRLPEPLRPERGGIDDRQFARHHLGEEPAADRPERQAEVVVGEVEPQARPAGKRPHDRAHVGEAGAAAEPGLRLLARPERKHFAREGLEPVEMGG